MESTSKKQPKRRILTDEQRDKKREVDKAKQRTNRAETKARLETIERDVALLRETVGELAQHVRQITNVPQSGPSTVAEGEKEEEEAEAEQVADGSANMNSQSPHQKWYASDPAATADEEQAWILPSVENK